MVDRSINIVGQQFGRLTAIERVFDGKDLAARWRCSCVCGGEIIARSGHLRNGRTTSCGCFRLEMWDKQITKHGYARSPTYQSWRDMRGRCSNPNYKSYANYGGRGITVCSEWDASFEAFLADMGECPDGLTLDRRDNSFGYFKENCHWATMKAQQNNKRTNIRIEYGGKSYTLTQLAEEHGLCVNTLKFRLKAGWPLEKALVRTQNG